MENASSKNCMLCLLDFTSNIIIATVFVPQSGRGNFSRGKKIK